MASPSAPLRWLRASLPSSFMWPIIASIAERLRSSRRIVGVITRRWPATNTAVSPLTPCPRWPRSA
jgi:hypothetical protein